MRNGFLNSLQVGDVIFSARSKSVRFTWECPDTAATVKAAPGAAKVTGRNRDE